MQKQFRNLVVKGVVVAVAIAMPLYAGRDDTMGFQIAFLAILHSKTMAVVACWADAALFSSASVWISIAFYRAACFFISMSISMSSICYEKTWNLVNVSGSGN
ncbi:hypothetical protein Tco_0833204 [Tanacetum coccineum]